MPPPPGVNAGLAARTFAEPVPTAVAAAAALGCELGAIANSLVFAAAGEPLLVPASGAHRVDTTKLERRLGCGKIRRATFDQLLTLTNGTAVAVV